VIGGGRGGGRDGAPPPCEIILNTPLVMMPKTYELCDCDHFFLNSIMKASFSAHNAKLGLGTYEHGRSKK